MKKESKQEITEIFARYLEDVNEKPSEEVLDAYHTLRIAWNKFEEAVAEDNFIKGYRYAVRLISKEDVKI